MLKKWMPWQMKCGRDKAPNAFARTQSVDSSADDSYGRVNHPRLFKPLLS